MAIRINRNKLKLSPEQVQEARFMYYHHCESAPSLAWKYNVSESIMRDAIYGKRGYASIPDPEKLNPKTKDPKYRADLKAMASDYKSQRRRDKRESNRIFNELVEAGLPVQVTPLHLAKSPANIDWKDEQRKERVAQNRHWKGWD
jgi:hypothetical protein